MTGSVPLLKPPAWTWEVPAYFLVGGASGAAAVIAAIAGFRSDAASLSPVSSVASLSSIAEHARWISAAGALIAPPLLISDLGRPARFLNMLRVFKIQSPMSVGAWTLAVFSAAAVASLAAHEVGDAPEWVALAGALAAILAALTGLVLATYTGVLLGVTAIPVWAAHVRVLPLLFGLSGLGAAVSLLELVGDRTRPLNVMGIGVALAETCLFVWLERPGSLSQVNRGPIHHGASGAMTRLAGLLSGPIALVLRLSSIWMPSVRLLASVAMIVGSALSRVGWIAAGRVSAQDLDSSLR
jgi:formate-dependent nitrite reductase membrane component NrfD